RRDDLGHGEDERLARAEEIPGRLEASRWGGIGDPSHRCRDQRQEVRDLGARAVETEDQSYQELTGADQHRGAVARDPVHVAVHGDDAAGARHILHDDGGLAFDVAGEPVGDNATVEVGGAARWKTDQHLDLLALIDRRLRGGGAGGKRHNQRRRGDATKHRHRGYSAASIGVCAASCSAKIGRPTIRTSMPPSEVSRNSSRPENAEYLRSASPFTAPSPLSTKPT